MSKNEIVNLIIKVLGLYVIVLAIGMIQYPAAVFSQQLINTEKTFVFFIGLFISLIPVALMFGAGFMLICKTDKFATALFDEDSKAEGMIGKLSAQEIQAVAFSVIGLYFL